MIYEIEFSEQAETDLRNIYDYIALELKSLDNSSRQLDRLEAGILKLSQMPERFREYENEPWRSRGLRMMPVDNYCVLYIPDTEKVIVYIVRVMYGGRDLDTQLNKYTKMEIKGELKAMQESRESTVESV